MAALAKDRNTPRRDGEFIRVPVKAAETIYAGSLVCSPATGYAEPANAAASLTALGRAEELADNSAGAAGDISVLVRRGVFRWANSQGAGALAGTDIGAKAYFVDDQTVTKAAAGSSEAGIVLGVDSEGVWVETR